MAKEKITARARTQYTDYMVKEPMELMEFLAAKMPDASRTKLKSLLSKRIIYVDSVITTQYNFPLKPGMNPKKLKKNRNLIYFGPGIHQLPGDTLMYLQAKPYTFPEEPSSEGAYEQRMLKM